jgi:hypothetical protein
MTFVDRELMQIKENERAADEWKQLGSVERTNRIWISLLMSKMSHSIASYLLQTQMRRDVGQSVSYWLIKWLSCKKNNATISVTRVT